MGAFEDEPDTTDRLTRPHVQGLRARVESPWLRLDKLRPKLTLLQYWGQRRKVARTIRAIRGELKRRRAPVPERRWDRRDPECACDLRIAKTGLIEDLRERVRRAAPASSRARLPHFLEHREWGSYYLPVEFDRPFTVRGGGRDVIPIGSSSRLRAELDLIDQALRFREQVNAEKMAAYLKVSETDITRFDTQNTEQPEFWHAFAFSVLQKLAGLSIERGLPVIFQ